MSGEHSTNEYGWVSLKPYQGQFNGFYIDKQERILFWPEHHGPGYVIKADMIDEIVDIISYDRAIWWFRWGVLALIAWISHFISFDLVFADGTEPFPHFSLPVQQLTLFVSCLMFLAILWDRLLDGTNAKLAFEELMVLLEGCETLSLERPPFQKVKSSAILGAAVFWKGMLLGHLTLLGFFLISYLGLNEWGDRIIVFIAGCIGWYWLCAWEIYSEFFYDGREKIRVLFEDE